MSTFQVSIGFVGNKSLILKFYVQKDLHFKKIQKYDLKIWNHGAD